MQDEYLDMLMEFDAHQLFKILTFLYQGKAWLYFDSMKKDHIDSLNPEDVLARLESKCRNVKQL